MPNPFRRLLPVSKQQDDLIRANTASIIKVSKHLSSLCESANDYTDTVDMLCSPMVDGMRPINASTAGSELNLSSGLNKLDLKTNTITSPNDTIVIKHELIQMIEPEYRPEVIRIPSGSIIRIAYVYNHSTVFVRPKSSGNKTFDQYTRFIKVVNEYANQSKPFSGKPKLDDIVLAPSALNALYGRAVVTDIVNDDISVDFLDFGFKEIVDLTQLKTLCGKLKKEPRFLNTLNLKGVSQNVPNARFIFNYLTKLCQDQINVMIKYDKFVQKTPLCVDIEGELFEEATNVSINQKIIDWNMPTVKSSNNFSITIKNEMENEEKKVELIPEPDKLVTVKPIEERSLSRVII